jgi:hypothetical protein
MTTWTTEDREALEKGLDFFKKLKGKEIKQEPIPFMGWVNIEDEDDIQQMLRDQIHIQQNRIQQLEAEVMMLQQECSALIKQTGEIQ